LQAMHDEELGSVNKELWYITAVCTHTVQAPKVSLFVPESQCNSLSNNDTCEITLAL